MLKFNVQSITSVKWDHHKRNPVETQLGRKDSNSYCACRNYNERSLCGGGAFKRGDVIVKVHTRINMVIQEDGSRKPWYRYYRWRPDCFFTTLSADFNWWKSTTSPPEVTSKTKGRPGVSSLERDFNLEPGQRDYRRFIQKRLAVNRGRLNKLLSNWEAHPRQISSQKHLSAKIIEDNETLENMLRLGKERVIGAQEVPVTAESRSLTTSLPLSEPDIDYQAPV